MQESRQRTRPRKCRLRSTRVLPFPSWDRHQSPKRRDPGSSTRSLAVCPAGHACLMQFKPQELGAAGWEEPTQAEDLESHRHFCTATQTRLVGNSTSKIKEKVWGCPIRPSLMHRPCLCFIDAPPSGEHLHPTRRWRGISSLPNFRQFSPLEPLRLESALSSQRPESHKLPCAEVEQKGRLNPLAPNSFATAMIFQPYFSGNLLGQRAEHRCFK